MKLSVLRWIGCFLLFAVLGTQTLMAQVSTTVTMSAVPIAGSPFASLSAAITAVNGLTITGPVVVTAAAGSETAPAGSGYYITATGTVANTIIIQGTATTTITAGANTVAGNMDAIFKIVGGDYITIRNFTMQENAVSNTVTATGATNTMTEAAVLLIHTSATDGASNNTIQNNIITLNAAYPNSVGILSTSSSSTTNASPGANTTLDATSTAGTNSNNKVYSNNISNVAYGVYFICPPITATVFETGNDIGGTSAATANTITFGNATPTTGPWNRSFTTTHAGIAYRNGAGNSIRFNTVTSSSLAYTGTTGLNGVIISSGTAATGVTYTSTISNNIIALTNTGTVLNTGIDFGFGLASTGTIACNTNTVTINQNAITTVSAAVIGIKANYAAASSSVSSNGVTINQSFTATATVTASSALTGITAPGTTTGTPTMNVNGNTILLNRSTNVSSTFTATMSGALIGIQATLASTTMNVGTAGAGNNNTITVKEAAGGGAGTTSYTSAVTMIDANAVHATVNVVNNTFNTTGSTIRSTGNFTCVNQNSTVTVLVNIKGNTATIDRVATTGTLVSFTTTTGSPSEVADTVSNNNITFTSISGSTTVTAISSLGGPSSPAIGNKSICNNTISISSTSTGTHIGISSGFTNTGTFRGNTISISCAGATVTGLTTTSTGPTISNNTISLTSSATSPTAMTGIAGSGTSGTFNVSNNTITSMSFTGVFTAGPTVIGINLSGTVGTNAVSVSNNNISGISVGASGCTGNATVVGMSNAGSVLTLNKNTICGISTLCSGATTLVSGMRITNSSGTSTISNNRIGDLNASAAVSADAIRGINITSSSATTTLNVYYNTVRLNASTTAATFGNTCLFHTSAIAGTANLDLRNNILSNASSTAGTGLAVAYRRSSNAITNYLNTSDRNNFEASTIYTDGTNMFTAIGPYKAFVSTADANSISVNSPFLSTSCGNSNFLKINTTVATQIESGALNITGITDDFEGDIRQSNTGYAGSGTFPDIGADEFNGTPAPVCAGTPAATSISGSSAVCAGFGTNLSLGTIYTDLGITYQWASSTVSGGPYTNLSTSASQATGALTVTTYYVCTITCANSGLSITTSEFSVNVNPLPVVSLSSSSATYCNPGTGVSLTASGANTYSWSPTTGLSPTSGANVTATPSSSTIYTVIGTDGNGCTATSNTSITVLTAVTGVTALASSTTICNGTSIDLSSSSNSATSTVFSEGFETGATGWVFTDSSSTGTAIAQQIWHVQASPYTDPTGSITFSNFSVSGSNFAYANADAGGSGSQTRTFMTSPSFSTVGYTGNGTLTFKMVYKFWGSSVPAEQVYVQISGDGGTTWNTIKDYSPTNTGPDVGTTTSNAEVAALTTITVPSAFMGNPDCKIRWRYLSNWGYVWIVDDVKLAATPIYSYSWNSTPAGFSSSNQNPTGVTPAVSTNYQVTVSGGGCSASSNVSVTVNQPTSNTTNVTACNTYTWAVNGTTYTTSGTYISTSTNAAGCLHTETLNLTINASTSNSSSATACDSYTWAENGMTYTSSGTYTAISTNAAGCPHTETLNLTINSSTSNSTSAIVCDGYTWAVNGMTYTSSGTYTSTSTNAAGCPHTETLNLVVNYSTSGTTTAIACDSYVWSGPLGDGMTYTSSNSTATNVTTNAAGCSHTEMLNLTVNYSTSGTTTATACDSYVWSGPLGNGNTYTSSNSTATNVTTNAAGCPHTQMLNLTVNYSTSSSMGASACDSYTWACNGQTYTTSGNYTCTYTNAAGCTHTSTLNLNIHYSTSSTEIVTACNNYTWSCNGQTYTTSGTYTCVGTNAAGCTHVTTLNLTINYSTSSTTTVIGACGSYTWSVNGQTYTQSGTYTVMSVNAAGCSHASILVLTVIPSVPTTVNQTQCGGSYTWTCNGQTYTQSGTYICGSGCYQVTLNLTINAIPVVTAGNISGCPGSAIPLIGSPSGGSYSLANPYTGTASSYVYFYTTPQGCSNSAIGTITYSTAVGNVSNLAVSGITSSSANITWGGNGVWFDVRYKTIASAVWTNAASSAALYKAITGLTALTTYTVEVRGYCEKTGIPTAWTGISFTTTGGSACAIPVPTTTTSITKSSAKLNWTHPGASYYIVRYKKTSASTWINIGTATPMYKLLGGLTANTQYEFQVQAVCSNTYTSAWSASGIFTTLASKMGEEDMPELTVDFNIFPNPTQDELNIIFPVEHNSTAVLRLVDMSGRTVKMIQLNAMAGNNEVSISLGDLANGIYSLQIISDDQLIHTTRVIKN